MLDRRLRKAADELERLGVRFVVVGGLAVAQEFPIDTQDVDLLVAMADYPGVLEALAGRGSMRYPPEDIGTMAGTELRVGNEWVPLDVINPKHFSGTRTGDEFVRFVRRHARASEGVRFASPATVWYMRIAVPDWEIYLQKLVRDVRAGVPKGLLDEAEQIARRFGVADRFAARFQAARRAIDIA